MRDGKPPAERIPILKMGEFLLVTIQVEMHDRLVMGLQDELTQQIVQHRARGGTKDVEQRLTDPRGRGPRPRAAWRDETPASIQPAGQPHWGTFLPRRTNGVKSTFRDPPEPARSPGNRSTRRD